MANAPPGQFYNGPPTAVPPPGPDPNFVSMFQAAPYGLAPVQPEMLFASLLEMQWRGVSFPTVSFGVELRQDLAIHKLADRDGAYIEGTGRAPLQFTARIPFINGLTPGTNEHWTQPLYPTAWRAFFTACADKTTGVFQHPELGQITCKIESCRTEWTAEARGGAWVNATWLETDDSDIDQVAAVLGMPSPTSQVAVAADDLDNALAAGVVGPSLPTFPFTFGDLAFALRGIIDTPSLMSKEFGGRIDNVLYQANTLIGALKGNDTSAMNWPMYDAAIQLQSACFDLKSLVLTKGKTVGIYTTITDGPLYVMAQRIPAPLEDVMTLNSSLVSLAIVPAGSRIRYYKKSG